MDPITQLFARKAAVKPADRADEIDASCTHLRSCDCATKAAELRAKAEKLRGGE